jgi:hypothetical protein
MKLLRDLLIAAVVLGASASAFASTAYLSGTVQGSITGNYTQASMSSAGGAPEGTSATITANAGTNGVWTITAGMSINLSLSDTITITLWTANNHVSGDTATFSRVRFVDSSGNYAELTSSPLGGSVIPGTDGTITPFTFNTSYANYSLNGSFDRSSVVSIVFDLTVANSNGKITSLDALRVTSVPEPGALALFSLGALSLGFLVRRSARARRAAKPVAR